MKITIYQLISTLNIEKELLPQKLPIRTAYNLSKIFARAREELEFYQEKSLWILNYLKKWNNLEFPVLDFEGQ